MIPLDDDLPVVIEPKAGVDQVALAIVEAADGAGASALDEVAQLGLGQGSAVGLFPDDEIAPLAPAAAAEAAPAFDDLALMAFWADRGLFCNVGCAAALDGGRYRG